MKLDRVIYILGAVCAVLLGIDFVYHRHAYIELEGMPGFYALAGILLPATLLLGGIVLKFLFGRDEDYYGLKDVASEAFPQNQIDMGQTEEGKK